MKKLFSTVLVLVLALAMLAGCAGTATTGAGDVTTKPAGTTTGAASTTAAEGTEAPDEGLFPADDNFNMTGYPIANSPVTFTTLVATGPSQADDWNEYTAQIYWSEYTNVYFDFEYVSSTDWDTQVNLKLSTGDFPDLIKSPLNTTILQTHGVEGGKFLDYSDYYQTYMPQMAKAFDNYPEIKAFGTMADGGIYELVQYIWTYTMATPIYYRDDMRQEMGAEIPTTVDEFYELLVDIKDHYSDVEGYYPFISNTSNMHNNLFPAFGPGWQVGFGDNGDGKVTYNYATEQWRHYLEFAAKLYAEKLIDQEIFTMDAATINAKVKDALCFFNGNVGTQLTAAHYASGEVETKILPPLVSEFDSVQKVRGLATSSWCGVVINKNCESPQYLMRYFDMFYTEPEDAFDGISGLASWLGIQGTDWDLSEDGENYFRILPDDTFGLSEEEYKNKYVYGGGYTGLVILDKFPINNPTQEMKAYESADKYYPYMKDLLFDAQFKYSDEDAAQIANLMTDIETYVNTATAQFINGTAKLDDASWDDYIKTIEQMGIDEVLSLKQEGYERWKEAMAN